MHIESESEILLSERNPRIFFFNSKVYNTGRAKLENDVKDIFYKNECPKLNNTIKDLLGECDFPS